MLRKKLSGMANSIVRHLPPIDKIVIVENLSKDFIFHIIFCLFTTDNVADTQPENTFSDIIEV